MTRKTREPARARGTRGVGRRARAVPVTCRCPVAGDRPQPTHYQTLTKTCVNVSTNVLFNCVFFVCANLLSARCLVCEHLSVPWGGST